jgi:hypothetical protein
MVLELTIFSSFRYTCSSTWTHMLLFWILWFLVTTKGTTEEPCKELLEDLGGEKSVMCQTHRKQLFYPRKTASTCATTRSWLPAWKQMARSLWKACTMISLLAHIARFVTDKIALHPTVTVRTWKLLERFTSLKRAVFAGLKIVVPEPSTIHLSSLEKLYVFDLYPLAIPAASVTFVPAHILL